MPHTTAPGHDAPEFHWLDCRRALRHDTGLEATVRDTAQPLQFQPARVLDISCTGMALVVSQSYAAGTLLEIEIPRAAPLFPQPLQVHVRHVTDRPGGYWVAGCELVKPLSIEELRLLLS